MTQTKRSKRNVSLEIFHYSHAAKNKALDAAKETKSVTVTRPDRADPNVLRGIDAARFVSTKNGSSFHTMEIHTR